MRKIVLASASPRRAELLRQTGIKFEVEPAANEEAPFKTGDPHEYARSLSLSKAREVGARHNDALVIAADTFGMLDGRFIGKPRTPAGAVKILESMSGKRHTVISGFTVLDSRSGDYVSRSVETGVYFRKLSRGEVEAYVTTGEPLDKAGAYAIQGKGAALVERIEGDYYNVVGLPLAALAEALKEFGVDTPSLLSLPPRER